jgi:tripartite-type tricarboxylate transporter receptor subunit TctC
MKDFAARYGTPLETVRPRSGRLIEGFSVKLQRRVRLFSHSSFAQWIRLEADPSILGFCERPARVGSNPETRLIDFWVRRADTQELILVDAPQEVPLQLYGIPVRCVTAAELAAENMANVGPNAISQSIYDKLPYDTVKSFEPIVQTTLIPIVLVVGPQVKANSMKELLAELKSNPGKYTYGSAGKGSSNHLTGALFASMAGVDMLHVPYKGDAPALTDVMGGQVSMMFTTVVAAMPHVKGGRVRALGIATDHKVLALPDVPTISESAVKGFDAASWGGLVAPAGTPSSTVEDLYRHTVEGLNTPDIKKKLADLGAEVVESSPAKFKAYIQNPE